MKQMTSAAVERAMKLQDVMGCFTSTPASTSGFVIIAGMTCWL